MRIPTVRTLTRITLPCAERTIPQERAPSGFSRKLYLDHCPYRTTQFTRRLRHITQNWRRKPLRTLETIVDLIGNTRTDAGLRVRAELDTGKCPKGVTATDTEMHALSLHPNQFRADWDYELQPR